MNIVISEVDRQNAKNIALKNIARFFDIQDWEIKSNSQLEDDIYSLPQESAVEISKLLKAYFQAYDDWFTFYQTKKTDREKDIHIITANEKEELTNLILNRNKTLNELQDFFEDLQIRKFNFDVFGTDLKGVKK